MSQSLTVSGYANDRARVTYDDGGVLDVQPRGAADTAYPRDLGELHERLVNWFEEAERASLEAREDAERCRDYFNGIQWTKAELDALRLRGQPPTTINYIMRKVQLLCGLERKARTDPKAFPRTPSEDERADAATQALRYVADDNAMSITRSAVFENMLVEGFGGVEVGLIDDGRGGYDITITRVPWDRLWYDPHSAALDFGDARYLGVVIWMDREQLAEMFPDAEDIIADTFSAAAGTYDDRPGRVVWSDSTRKRVRIAQCHWQERGAWWSVSYSRQGLLSHPTPSPFKDRRGKSSCPLMLQSSFVDRENRRFGFVRDLISLQDEVNKRRSKALHLLSVNRIVAEQGAVADVDKARREAARPDGYIEHSPGLKFEIENGGDLAMAQFHLLQHATQEMQLSGPNAAMSGTDPREQSGRAILAQQAGGATQNEPLADSLRMWARRVYETCWMAVREYWTAGKWVRVTDELGEMRWVGINYPVTLRDKLAEMPEQHRMMAMQQMQLQPGDPRLQQVVEIRNDITDLDVDITIEEGQDIPFLAAEDFQSLIQLASLQPGLIPGDVLIAASNLRNKDDLLNRMKEHQEQQAQKQQQMEPLMRAGAEAEVRGKQAKAAADMALAKEREHKAIHTIADVHQMHHERLNPPGEPMPEMSPAMTTAHQLADLRTKHRQSDVHEATVLQKLAQAKAALRPPPAGNTGA